MTDQIKAENIQKCARCRKGVMHCGHVTCHQIKVSRLAFSRRAIEQMAGMELMMQGNVPLARQFCDLEVAEVLGDEITIWLCDDCAYIDNCIPVLVEDRPKIGERT